LLITDLVCIAFFILFFWKLCPLIFFFFCRKFMGLFLCNTCLKFSLGKKCLLGLFCFCICFVIEKILWIFFLILINMDSNGYSEIKFCNINTWTRNQNFYPNLIGYKPNLTLLSFRYSWSICWGIHWASVEYPCTNLNHSRQCWILMKEN